jgi:hypothetical protein
MDGVQVSSIRAFSDIDLFEQLPVDHLPAILHHAQRPATDYELSLQWNKK